MLPEFITPVAFVVIPSGTRKCILLHTKGFQ
jgi:hypothetical protein